MSQRPLFAGHPLGHPQTTAVLDVAEAEFRAIDAREAERERRALNEAIYLEAIRRFFARTEPPS